MQDVQRFQYGGDLLAHKSLRLPSLDIEPSTDVAMLGVLHHQAVAGACCLGHDESVEHPERSRLSLEELSEIGFAEPAGDPVADLDAHLRRERSRWGRRRKIDLAEAPFADQTVQAVSPTCFVAVDGGKGRAYGGCCGRPGRRTHRSAALRRGGVSPRAQDRTTGLACSRDWSCHSVSSGAPAAQRIALKLRAIRSPAQERNRGWSEKDPASVRPQLSGCEMTARGSYDLWSVRDFSPSSLL